MFPGPLVQRLFEELLGTSRETITVGVPVLPSGWYTMPPSGVLPSVLPLPATQNWLPSLVTAPRIFDPPKILPSVVLVR